MERIAVDKEQVVQCKGDAARNWHAWLNIMPPKPDDFHVSGEVMVGNPGIYAMLRKKEPQGINPAILLLDLFLIQKPGEWIQQASWTAARYDEVITGEAYTEVDVFCESEIISRLPVSIVT